MRGTKCANFDSRRKQCLLKRFAITFIRGHKMLPQNNVLEKVKQICTGVMKYERSIASEFSINKNVQYVKLIAEDNAPIGIRNTSMVFVNDLKIILQFEHMNLIPSYNRIQHRTNVL